MGYGIFLNKIAGIYYFSEFSEILLREWDKIPKIPENNWEGIQVHSSGHLGSKF